MKDIKVLLYPQVARPHSGPSNVVYYLSDKLRKYVTIYDYPPPPFSASNMRENLANTKRLIYIWSNLGARLDIVHFLLSPSFIDGGFPLSLFAKAKGVPVVLNVHGILHMELGLLQRTSAHTLSKAEVLMLSKSATRVVVNSKFMLNNVVEWYGVNPERVAVIPNGISVKHFQDCENNVRLDGDPCILYVGRIAIEKGVDTLIKALAIVKHELPDVKVHLVGGLTESASSLKLLIAKEGLEKNIVFHKWASQFQIPCYYRSADFCVFPNVLESFGIVILEAMASGAPIIASDIPAFKELLCRGTTGLFFQKGNPHDLGRNMLRLASDSNLKMQLSKNASAAVQIYDWENIAKEYLRLYNSLLG